jgi:hypothetical protein
MSETSGAAEPRPAGLVRGLGLLDATLLIVGSVIGSGIFFAPSIMAGYVLAINTGFVAAVAVAFAKTLGFFVPGVGEEHALVTLVGTTFTTAQLVALVPGLGLPGRAAPVGRSVPVLPRLHAGGRPPQHRAGAAADGGRHPRLPLLATAPVSHTVF